PLETWTYRILHVAGGLMIVFALMAWRAFATSDAERSIDLMRLVPAGLALALAAYAALAIAAAWLLRAYGGMPAPPPWVFDTAAPTLVAAVVVGIGVAWATPPERGRIALVDWALILTSATVAGYLLFHVAALQFRAGVMPTRPDFWVTLAGVLLILEATRRVAGLPLVAIAAIFIIYAFTGPWLPGILQMSR
ncbi:MAG: hypothetical protein R6W90_15160, partial [Ignavibacteriaceae bacterium]